MGLTCHALVALRPQIGKNTFTMVSAALGGVRAQSRPLCSCRDLCHATGGVCRTTCGPSPRSRPSASAYPPLTTSWRASERAAASSSRTASRHGVLIALYSCLVPGGATIGSALSGIAFALSLLLARFCCWGTSRAHDGGARQKAQSGGRAGALKFSSTARAQPTLVRAFDGSSGERAASVAALDGLHRARALHHGAGVHAVPQQPALPHM